MIVGKRMRLREIVQVDGRKSTLTNFQIYDKNRRLIVSTFSENDCVLLVNVGRTVLKFVHGFNTITDSSKTLKRVLMAVELRLDKGAWNPLLLADYAKLVGIDLANLKFFADHYKAEQKRRAEARKER